MNRLAWNFIIIAVATLIAVANPAYRYFSLKQPIVTLGLDLKGGVEVLLKAVPENGTKPTEDQMNGVRLVVENRVDPQSVKEITLTQVGLDRLLLQVPGEKNPDSIIEIIGETALLEWINTGDKSFDSGTDFNVEGTSERKEEYAIYDTILTGANLKKADVTFDHMNRPMIAFELDAEGGDVFGQFTNDHVGQYLTVLLDGKVVTSPVINSAIWGGSGVIEGNFTLDEASKVVRQLNAGALPVPLSILSSSVVGPTLGQDSINHSLLAGLAGFLLVLLFLIIVYRLPGVVAGVALILYVVLVIGYFSLINATMTLPGIAGFLLSIGMAIDGNIIIFERLKEEIRWGKTLVAAQEAAFSRAWAAILDGNLVTMIAAAVLYFYGTGPVKGFAVTLFIGNIIALFSAVFVTRNIMDVVIRWWNNTRLYAAPVKSWPLPTEMLHRGLYFRYIERTPIWIGISLVVIAIGLGFVFLNKSTTGSMFNLGLDYTGGEQLVLKASQEFALDGQDVARIIEKYSDGEPVVQVDLSDPRVVSVRMQVKASGETEKELSDSRTAALVAMKEEIGIAFGGYVAAGETGANPEVLQQDYVGPTVGQELIIKAIASLFIGSVLISIYIFARFARWSMGISGIIGVIHDVLITLAAAAAFKLEINASFIAVILTIVGYSINDKVIVYDRIRENLRTFGDSAPLGQLCNLSISQVILRSVNTMFAVILTILALLFFGGSNIRDFMIAMLVGMISGGYSSIYIATPMMMWFSRGQLKFADGAPEGPAASSSFELDLPDETEPRGGGGAASQEGSAARKKAAGKKQRRR